MNNKSRRLLGRMFATSVVVMQLLSGCGGGGGSNSGEGSSPNLDNSTQSKANAAPAVSVLLAGEVVAGGTNADATVNAGSDIVLNAASSTDPDGDSLSYKWSIASKPANSALAFTNDSAAQVIIRPDFGGNYVLNLRVSDSKGAYSDKRVTLQASNSAPAPVIAVSATYSPIADTKPTQNISVGSSIVLDGTGSTDPDGDLITTSWSITEKPVNSTATLTVAGQTARFFADGQGIYKVRARGEDSRGAYFETLYVFDATNRAPNAVLLATVNLTEKNAGQNTVQASVGYSVSLTGQGSIDPDGNSISYAWSLSAKPVGSAAVLDKASGASAQFAPDVLGDYVIKLTATDPAGASSYYTTTVSVKNRSPIAAIATNAAPIALPSGPTVRLPVGTQLTLRGSGSSDADGDTLTYSWSINSKPTGSTATLSSADSINTQIVPDKEGSYTIRLRVSDSSGAYSDKLMTIAIGNYAPVAVIDKIASTVTTGASATASAALSYDDDGDSLTYTWAIDARPSGSNAAIANPNGASLSFIPDVTGSYVVSVTVNDGKSSNVGYLTLRAIADMAGNVQLSFAPLDARYSKALDKMVVYSTNPNALKIIDPFTSVIKSVVLPSGVKSLSLSPDGKLAAVLHEGALSLIDLETAQLINSSATGGSQTDALVTNSGVTYLIGQTGGQWVSPSVSVLDARTGQNLSPSSGGYFYGTQRGIFANTKNKIFLLSQGLSPSDISYFTIDPKTNAVLTTGDSPYHGDYSMNTPFFLSDNQDLLFTSSGTYFQTETLRYAGRFTLNGKLISLSHSSAANETVVMQASGGGYPTYASAYEASYKRFTGALFQPDTDLTLPLIAGKQSYGIAIFHSANGKHVALVQTGTAEQNGAGVQYFVMYR